MEQAIGHCPGHHLTAWVDLSHLEERDFLRKNKFQWFLIQNICLVSKFWGCYDVTSLKFLIKPVLTKSCDNIVTSCDAEECDVSYSGASVYSNNVKVRIRPGHYRLNIDIVQTAGLGVIILPLGWTANTRCLVTTGWPVVSSSSPVIGQCAPAPAPAHPITAP